MKYYCIDIDGCGYGTHKENEWQASDERCPLCWSFLLAYEDNETPSFVEPQAPYSANTVVEKESGESK